jgi:predicted PurR-regulated permease PerM
MDLDAVARGDRRSLGAVARVLWLAAGIVLLLRFLDEATAAVLFLGLSMVIALALNVPVVALERRGLGRGLATAVVCLVVVGVLVGVGFLVVPPTIDQATEFAEQVPIFADQLNDRAAAWLADHPDLAARVREENTSIVPIVQQGLTQAGRTGVTVVTLVASFFLVLTSVVFMLLRPRPLLDAYLSLFPSSSWDRAEAAFLVGANGVVGWLFSNVIVGTIEAVAAGIFLSVMDVPAAAVWAVLTFFAELVPYLGVYLMTVPPVLVSFAVDPWLALWVLLFYLGLTLVCGNVIAPWLRGRTMDLHPVTIIVAIVALGALYGPLGVLLAAPVAGFGVAFWDAFYLAGRPADPERAARIDALVARRRRPGVAAAPGRAGP